MQAKMLEGKVAIVSGASYGMGFASDMGKHVKGQVIQVCNGAFL